MHGGNKRDICSVVDSILEWPLNHRGVVFWSIHQQILVGPSARHFGKIGHVSKTAHPSPWQWIHLKRVRFLGCSDVGLNPGSLP